MKIALKIILTIIFIFKILSKKNKILKKRNLEITPEISVKVYGTGTTQQLINPSYSGETPNIYLNDDLLCENCKQVDNLEEEENIFLLKFNEVFAGFNSMFKGLENIREINFSNFYLEDLAFMKDMFNGCKNLQYINISNDTNLIPIFSFSNIFNGCQALISLDISGFDTSEISSMESLFYQLQNLKYLDISNFNTENVYNMNKMFYNCKSLEFLDLSNFKTNNLEIMNCMFYHCESLTSIVLSSFDTTQVTDMTSLFNSCYKLQSLDLSNFITNSLKDMGNMFIDCISLTFLNIINFDTSQTTNMYNLFSNCYSLTTLDLSNFDTSSVIVMIQMFHGCKSLKSLDLSNFQTSSLKYMNSMFKGCTSLESINISSFDTSSVIGFQQLFEGCESLVSLDLLNFETNLISDMNSMFKDCKSLTSLNLSKFNLEQVTTVDEMFLNCIKLEYINFGDAKAYDSVSTHNTFSGTPMNIVYCINVAEKIKNALLEVNGDCSQSDCSDNWKEKQLIIEGTNSCKSNLNVNTDKTEEIEDNQSDDNNKIEYDNICHAKDFFEKKCRINSENVEEREKMKKIIIDEIMDGSMDELLLNSKMNKKKLLISDVDKYEIEFLSDQYHDSNNNNISSKINFDKCQKILKDEYHFNENDKLILFKIEYFLQGFNIPIIEYEIFSPNGTIKLNLEFCQNTSISIYIPVNIDENNLYLYDPTSDFYNDRCNPYTTKSKTDITLYDRKNEFNNQNMSLCEKNCVYKGYNFDNKDVECECRIKTKFRFFSEINNLKPEELLKNFVNIKQIINIGVIKCYKLLFSKDGIIYNIGSYILLIIIFITIIESIFFCVKGYQILFLKIKEIYNLRFNNSNLNINIYEEKSQIIIKNNESNKKDSEILNFKKKKTIIKKKKKIKVKKNTIKIFSNSNFNLNSSKKNDSLESTLKSKNNSKLNDYELNSLSYKEALIYDKRTHLEYYFSLLRTKHLIIFSFFEKNDYNSRIIKRCLFLFSFALYYIVNALFFNDSTMHKIYEDKGIFNFLFQLPLILYSTIISAVIKKILTILSLTEKSIVEIKNENNLEIATDKMKKLLKCLIIKFILFFIIDFLLIILFWYYIACFCAVYKNTQTYLIKNTVTSFSISLLYPFIFNIIPCLLRIAALKDENKDKVCVYKISLIFQIF